MMILLPLLLLLLLLLTMPILKIINHKSFNSFTDYNIIKMVLEITNNNNIVVIHVLQCITMTENQHTKPPGD
jgi:hypothetical protein